jgi:hypothetical protein
LIDATRRGFAKLVPKIGSDSATIINLQFIYCNRAPQAAECAVPEGILIFLRLILNKDSSEMAVIFIVLTTYSVSDSFCNRV